jgi:two-component system, chemotaxis family, CheB/CheR fusion protein
VSDEGEVRQDESAAPEAPGDDHRSQPDDHPSRAPVPDLIVGLGASAGGIVALKNFFSKTSADTGLAYVVILHLAPDHESHLAEVLQTATRMPVTQAQGRVAIEPDRVYVIPPNANLVLTDGYLTVSPIKAGEYRLAPVDFFFRTLAGAYGPKAVAVVLSGTGPDGASGIKRVKENGGLAIVQDPVEAEYEDMPRNSFNTGLIDFVARVAAIPDLIHSYQERLGQGLEDAPPQAPDPSTLREVLTMLRMRTGHDFSNYKSATLLRRIERRIHVHGLNDARLYVPVLRESPEEVGLLLNELLISVTNFFRDGEAYQTLEKRIVPALFENKQANDHVRVWAAGCATGEEAYSMAMLLTEASSASPAPPHVQVFATDLDERAIQIGREGLYTEVEVADVSDERLRRFFIRERTGFRVRRELRETVLFAVHNVIRDPPFSHLDVIACRNVLIYLNRQAQERLLQTFHFALRPGGFLFLGQSETADARDDLFVAIDKGSHIFEARTAVTTRSLPIAYEMPHVPTTRLPFPSLGMNSSDRMSPGDLHMRLLETYAAPSVLITEEYHVLHVSETAARFMELNAGEPSRNITQLVIPELRFDLRAALQQAAQQRTTVEVRSVRLSPQRGGGAVTISVRPALREYDPALGYFLVFFEPDPSTAAEAAPKPVRLLSPNEAPLPMLEEELSRIRVQLRATIEQYETHVEEAKAANEELQAMNEELRSAAEELETSKEELQSVNEELTTVNQELKLKIDELGLANNDLQNFINSTDIATIFLDRQLRVKLFTARSRDIFNLLSTDAGRPLSDITNSLNYTQLHEDVKLVLDRLHTLEREVETRDRRWFLMRVLPYRTSEDRIEGVVLTFVELRQRKQAEGRGNSAG